MKKQKTAVTFALLAAALYAINAPFAKVLSAYVSPSMMAGFLYLGAGVGMAVWMGVQWGICRKAPANRLQRQDLPYTVAMVVLDIAAPILLMLGIARTSSANVSLLNNLEIVATALIALVFFGEKISKRLWCGIALVALAGALLVWEGNDGFSFSAGSFYVTGACLCWGIENNCTRSISHKSSEQIVTVKGVFSGLGSIGVALLCRERFPSALFILLVMTLGFVAYGLSIRFYIMAQSRIGAAKTGAFYAVAPFLGVGFSFLFAWETPPAQFYIALGVMLLATVLTVTDTLGDSGTKKSRRAGREAQSRRSAFRHGGGA